MSRRAPKRGRETAATTAKIETKEVDVVVVGAGFGGLGATRHLLETSAAQGNKKNVVLLEAREDVGGRSQNICVNPDAPAAEQIWADGGCEFYYPPYHTHLAQLVYELSKKRKAEGLDSNIIIDQPRWLTDFQCSAIHALGGTYSKWIGSTPYSAGMIPEVSFGDTLALMIGVVAIRILEETIDQEHPWASWNTSVLGNLRDMTFAAWLDTLPLLSSFPKARAVIEVAIASIWSAKPEDLGLMYCVNYSKTSGGFDFLMNNSLGGAQQNRITTGTHSLCVYVKDLIEKELGGTIHLSTPVTSIQNIGKEQVRVTATDADGNHTIYVAKRAIVSGSPRVLRNIDFHHMPIEWKVLQQQNIGVSIKCFARYEKPWWRTDPSLKAQFDKFSGTIVSDHFIAEMNNGQLEPSDKQIAVNWVNDNSGKDCGPNAEGVYNGKEYVLMMFIEGDIARSIRKHPNKRKALEDACLDSLGLFFGDAGRTPWINFEFKDWQDEKYIQGGPTQIMSADIMQSAGSALYRPACEGTVRFAGTEYAKEFNGYMEGAYRSGIEQANNTLKDLGLKPASENTLAPWNQYESSTAGLVVFALTMIDKVMGDTPTLLSRLGLGESIGIGDNWHAVYDIKNYSSDKEVAAIIAKQWNIKQDLIQTYSSVSDDKIWIGQPKLDGGPPINDTLARGGDGYLQVIVQYDESLPADFGTTMDNARSFGDSPVEPEYVGQSSLGAAVALMTNNLWDMLYASGIFNSTDINASPDEIPSYGFWIRTKASGQGLTPQEVTAFTEEMSLLLKADKTGCVITDGPEDPDWAGSNSQAVIYPFNIKEHLAQSKTNNIYTALYVISEAAKKVKGFTVEFVEYDSPDMITIELDGMIGGITEKLMPFLSQLVPEKSLEEQFLFDNAEFKKAVDSILLDMGSFIESQGTHLPTNVRRRIAAAA